MEQKPESTSIVNQLGFLLKPMSLRGVPVWFTYILALLGLVYILNPTLGVFELIPDNLPWIGNLDEGAAYVLLWYGLVELIEGRKLRKLNQQAS